MKYFTFPSVDFEGVVPCIAAQINPVSLLMLFLRHTVQCLAEYLSPLALGI